MLCPVDRQTYTIRMEIDGIVRQFCQRCKTYHEHSIREEVNLAVPLPDKRPRPDPDRDKQS
jgi:hypothetical protein